MSYGKYGIDEEKKIILLEIAIKERAGKILF